jgi:hypothetical protein
MPSPKRRQNSKAFHRPNTRGVKGWVYVISNIGMPGLVKVGFTMNDPDERARGLAHTGNPHPYTVDYQVWVEDPYSVEQQAHKKLSASGYRVGEGRVSGQGIEWFSCKPEQAIVAIRHAAGGEYQYETFRRAERELVEISFQKEVLTLQAQKQVEGRIAHLKDEFKKSVDITFPPRPYWQYFLFCYVISVIALSALVSKMTDSQVFFASFFSGGIAAIFLQGMLEKTYVKSHEYLAMKTKHENDVQNANLHLFSCPHCSASMKINYVESFAEGNRIKFHCKSCDKDVPNPLAPETKTSMTKTGSQINPTPLHIGAREFSKLRHQQSQSVRVDELPLSNKGEPRPVTLSNDQVMSANLNVTSNQLILSGVEERKSHQEKTADSIMPSIAVTAHAGSPNSGLSKSAKNGSSTVDGGDSVSALASASLETKPSKQLMKLETKKRLREILDKVPVEKRLQVLRVARAMAKKAKGENAHASHGINEDLLGETSPSEVPLEQPLRLRSLFIKVWDSDCGSSKMREDLWHIFQAALALALMQCDTIREEQKERIAKASARIWDSRKSAYDKALWREADEAIGDALRNTWWR